MSVVGGQPKKHSNPSYKATEHIERTFLISDYYQPRSQGFFPKKWEGRHFPPFPFLREKALGTRL